MGQCLSTAVSPRLSVVKDGQQCETLREADGGRSISAHVYLRTDGGSYEGDTYVQGTADLCSDWVVQMTIYVVMTPVYFCRVVIQFLQVRTPKLLGVPQQFCLSQQGYTQRLRSVKARVLIRSSIFPWGDTTDFQQVFNILLDVGSFCSHIIQACMLTAELLGTTQVWSVWNADSKDTSTAHSVCLDVSIYSSLIWPSLEDGYIRATQVILSKEIAGTLYLNLDITKFLKRESMHRVERITRTINKLRQSSVINISFLQFSLHLQHCLATLNGPFLDASLCTLLQGVYNARMTLCTENYDGARWLQSVFSWEPSLTQGDILLAFLWQIPWLLNYHLSATPHLCQDGLLRDLHQHFPTREVTMSTARCLLLQGIRKATSDWPLHYHNSREGENSGLINNLVQQWFLQTPISSLRTTTAVMDYTTPLGATICILTLELWVRLRDLSMHLLIQTVQVPSTRELSHCQLLSMTSQLLTSEHLFVRSAVGSGTNWSLWHYIFIHQCWHMELPMLIVCFNHGILLIFQQGSGSPTAPWISYYMNGLLSCVLICICDQFALKIENTVAYILGAVCLQGQNAQHQILLAQFLVSQTSNFVGNVSYCYTSTSAGSSISFTPMLSTSPEKYRCYHYPDTDIITCPQCLYCCSNLWFEFLALEFGSCSLGKDSGYRFTKESH